MPGSKNVRPTYGPIMRHLISTVDPVLAGVTAESMMSHISPSTQRGYDSATNSYFSFCAVRGIEPWPCDSIWVCAWITQTVMHVSVRSMKVYLAALRSAQLDQGYEWSLAGNMQVARAVRAAKRMYGISGQALKVPISLATLAKMCRFLPGWPVPSCMSHDDRLFVCASSIAVMGFLRGGEFLFSTSSSRPMLRHRDVLLMERSGLPYVIVKIQRPKARWWLLDSDVLCFDPGANCPLNPSTWLRSY